MHSRESGRCIYPVKPPALFFLAIFQSRGYNFCIMIPGNTLSSHRFTVEPLNRLIVGRLIGLAVFWLGLAVFVGCRTAKRTADEGHPSAGATVTNVADAASRVAPVKAGFYCGLGSRGANSVYWAKILRDSPDVELVLLDGADLRNGKLDGLDILVVPGGSSRKQLASMRDEGAEAIRRYVRGGGKYFGTCAGLSLILTETNRIALLPLRRVDGYYARGGGDVKVEFNDKWMRELAITNANWSIRFHDGPVVTAMNIATDVRVEVMALCRNAVDEHRKKPAAQRDRMIGTPAFVYATCGQGEIIACNCHPEGHRETRELVSAVFGRLTGRRIAIPDFGNFPKNYRYTADGTKETLEKAVEKLGAPPVRAGLYCGPGSRGANNVYWAKILEDSPDVALTLLDADDIRGGGLQGLDILVMPGGGGRLQCEALAEEGKEAVRRYVREGGKYFGTCAGISAAINATNRLQMAPYRFITNYYERGTGTLQVGFNEKWRRELALADAAWKLHYHGGPIIIPGDPVPDGEGETMAVCLNAIEAREKRTPAERDAMIGTPAFIYATYGKGEVIACNAHPEARPETRELISAVFGRLTGRRIAIPNVRQFPKGYAYKADGTKETLRKAMEVLK